MPTPIQVKQPMVEQPADGCELNLSSDHQWMRLTVAGKLVASFHVNYVKKVLAKAEKSISKNSNSTSPEASVNN